MKIIFFIILWCNIALFLWEYRAGAFVDKANVGLEGKEQIVLLSETDGSGVKSQ